MDDRHRDPPDTQRGPRRDLGPGARRLVARAAGTDRDERARRRFAEVEVSEQRVRRRARLLTRAVWAVAILAAVGLGWLAAGAGGVLAGAVGLVVVFAVARAQRRVAERRGASAWDWQARRYRLWGSPAAEVQRADRHTSGRDPPRPAGEDGRR